MPTKKQIIGELSDLTVNVPGVEPDAVEAVRRRIIDDVNTQGITRRAQVWNLIIHQIPADNVGQDVAESEKSSEVEPDQRTMQIMQAFAREYKNAVVAGWGKLFGQLEIPNGFLQFFRLLGIPEEKWKSSYYLRKVAHLPQKDGGMDTDLKWLYSAITHHFGSFPDFVAKMEGKEKADPTIADTIRSTSSRDELRAALLGHNITETELQTPTAVVNEGRGERAAAMREATRKFNTSYLYLAYINGHWTPNEELISEIQDYDRDAFKAFIQENNMDYWRTQLRVAKAAGEEANKGNGSGLPIPEFYIAVIRRFGNYKKFVLWMDEEEEQSSWPDRVSKCKTPLDFIVLLMNEGVPPKMWENSEWLTKKAPEPPEKGGIGKSMVGFVGAIRKDPRFDGSYPNFVSWMYGKEEPERSMKDRVNDFEEPKDADEVYDELHVPTDVRKDFMKLAALARKRSAKYQTGRKKATIDTFMSAVLSRWGTWKQYVAWYEGKEKPDPTWDDKVIACNDRDDFLQLFSAEGIPGTKWRNSYWLNSGSKLPSSKGGVGRCFRNLQKALARRFGKFTLFLEYMDGIPEGGITSDEQADKLVCSEAQRLGTTPDKLLGYTGTTGIDFWRKSPALVRVLEHFSPDLSTEGRAKTIDAETIAGSLEQEYRTLERGQQDGDIDPDLLADYYSDVRRVARETVYARTQVSSPQELSELFVEIRKAVAAIPKQGLPKRVTQRVDRCRNRARNDLASNAGWQEAPLRTNNKLTDRGLSALNTARDRQGLGKIITSDVQFLRETLTEEEERGLEALVAELGEAARAEYLCAKFQDRFQYNHRTVENLRKWLGKVETYGGNPLEDVPIGLFTIKELSQLRHAFFNRMRDKYQKFYRQGIETVTRELEGSMDRASHPLQKDFIQELITYFAETEAIAHPSRLKTSIGEGEEFPAKHQKIAVKEIEKQRSMLVADEMGGGKTGSTIAAFEHLREQGKAHKALIMCPAQIVPVWKKALSGNNGSCFVDGRAPRTAFIESGNKNWEAAQDAEYIVMSIEMSRGGTRIGDPSLAIEHPDNRLAKKLGIQPGDTVSHEDLIKSLGADFFALDEAHNVKNPRGEDTERIFRISQSESVLNGHLMLLSGTPIPNTIRDIAAQLRLLYAGREEVDGIDITNLQSITKAILRGHPLLVRNLLVRRMLRRKTQECLPVENEYHREVVENKLSPLEQAQYDSILNCPFYEATEKIRLLRRLCLMSESKYKQVCSAVETALFRPKYEHEKAPKIVIAESWFARGVTRDQAHRHDVDDSEVDTYIAGRIRAEYDGIAKVFILDGTNSSRKDQILSEFEASEEPAILITLTAVAGEGLDISCASDGILITPTDTVAKEEQFARRMNRIGQEKDVHLQVLQIEDSIEQGIAEYAVRKAELVEEFLNGRPLTAEELCILEDDTTRINRGGFLAYEVMSPHEKILWIFSRIYGKGKEAVREFFELDDGKYAVDLARFYPLEEETSYQGNTARLIAGIISKYLSDGNAQIADIACGCRTMERMFRDNTNVSVASSDINGAMLSVGSEILGGDGSINEDEVCTMDELPYGEQSKDVAVLSLALHYTRHNPRKTGSASGKERVKALCEMNRVLKDGGIGIITLPVNTFEDEESFRNFCAVFERCLGFEVVAESSNLAHSIDNESEEPFDVWVLTVRKTGEPRAKEMTDGDWRALCLTKLKTATSSSIARTFGEDNEHETHGSYHEKFSIGGESVTFIPITDEQASFRDERNVEKERYGRIRNRISDLLREYGSMKDIPEEILLSISLEEVASADQHDRDEYFQMLLEHYGSVGRVPTKEISEESPVILIRGESKKGSYLCLGRIDGTRKKPCGYGRRYFYEQMA